MDHVSEKWCTHSERSPPADAIIWEKWKLKWSPQDQVRNPLLLSERNPQRKHCTSLGCHFSDCSRTVARMILAYGHEVSLSVVRSGRWGSSLMLPTAPEPDPQCFANLVLIWSGPKAEAHGSNSSSSGFATLCWGEHPKQCIALNPFYLKVSHPWALLGITSLGCLEVDTGIVLS